MVFNKLDHVTSRAWEEEKVRDTPTLSQFFERECQLIWTLDINKSKIPQNNPAKQKINAFVSTFSKLECLICK